MRETKIKVIILALLLCVIGSCMLHSVTGSVSKEISRAVYMMLAIGLAVGISFLQYHFLEKISAWAYLFGIVCVLLTFSPLGVVNNGVARWIRLGTFTLKVSEVVILSTIIALAGFVGRCINTYSKEKTLLGIWLIGGSSAVLLGAVTNDLSSGLLIFGITFGVSFLCTNTKILHLLVLGIAVIVFVIFTVGIYLDMPSVEELTTFPYWIQRIAVWIEPERYSDTGGYQIMQMLDAIKSGGVFGNGFGMSTHASGNLVGFEDDMILAIIIEEFGIAGFIMVLALIGMLYYLIYRVAVQSDSVFGRVLVTGIFVHLTLQSLINIAVVTNLLPYVSMPLPFISNGNTALLINMIEIGLVVHTGDSHKKIYESCKAK